MSRSTDSNFNDIYTCVFFISEYVHSFLNFDGIKYRNCVSLETCRNWTDNGCLIEKYTLVRIIICMNKNLK
jgi:hypothetical protein